jgi:cell division transport system permease protein
VLHLTGAEDAQISNLFELRFARIAAISGAIGATAAAILGVVLRLIGGGQGITPALPIAWTDVLAVLPCPLLAALVAALAARLTARRLIQDL